jgi:hypothetical protein
VKYKLQLCLFFQPTEQIFFILYFNIYFVLSSLAFVGILSVIGQKTFFAQQAEVTKELAKSGYVFGAYAEEDAIRKKDERIPKTKRIYSDAVRR